MDFTAIQLYSAALSHRKFILDAINFAEQTQFSFNYMKSVTMMLYTLTRDFQAKNSAQFTPVVAAVIEQTIETIRSAVTIMTVYGDNRGLILAPLQVTMFEN